MLDCLRRGVEIESPSNSKAAVDRLAAYFAREFGRQGATVRILSHRTAGSAVMAEFFSGQRKSPRGSKPILLLGHLDTVWDLGTLERMPFRIRGGRAYGPGVLDMKSGIVCGWWAIRALRALDVRPDGPVRFFLNSDEEVSSLAFRDRIIAEARNAKAVLVLEPAVPGGALKTARKGVGEFEITVYGRSAHAGVNPAAGVNAIAELARQLLRIEKFARPRRGLTLNVGVIRGGTRTNVIPACASATVDVRIPRLQDRRAIERKVYGLRPIHPEARLEIRGGINRPPMERARAIGLFRQARELGRRMGMSLREASTGGGSDGNFTAALGIPTLDGLGGVGDGAHALDEHIIIRELPRRVALIAALLATL
ncbi:MAG TPA: M20 family metallopeptidase [Terriglobia bacterium]|nr:M20 family metallopeptidase [Terriglobia bacterium]